jgi:hypothetical protein
MTTSVRIVPTTKEHYAGPRLAIGKITVTRSGKNAIGDTWGPSAIKPYGRPVITTLRKLRTLVPPDMWGDPYWGRGELVDGDLDEPFLYSNDTLSFNWPVKTGASKGHPVTSYMTVGDASDVDRTGSTFGFGPVKKTIPFGPSGRLFTFEIVTDEPELKFSVDSGSLPTAARPAGVGDGVSVRLPCRKK